MSPLKRAAVALANHDARQVDAPEIASVDEFRFDGERANYLSCARAVLEAIRDVDAGSPAILVAGKESLYSCSEDPELEDARKCFHAMIDAALKEG